MRCGVGSFTGCPAKAPSAKADVLVYDIQSAHAACFWLPQSSAFFAAPIKHSWTGHRPREAIYVCISTHLSSRGLQLRRAVLLDDAFPRMIPGTVCMARMSFSFKYSLFLLCSPEVRGYMNVSATLCTLKFFTSHDLSRPFFPPFDQSFLSGHCHLI